MRRKNGERKRQGVKALILRPWKGEGDHNACIEETGHRRRTIGDSHRESRGVVPGYKDFHGEAIGQVIQEIGRAHV